MNTMVDRLVSPTLTEARKVLTQREAVARRLAALDAEIASLARKRAQETRSWGYTVEHLKRECQ